MNLVTRSFTRRRFLKSATVAAAATGVPLWFLEREQALAATAAPVLGPNDRPGLALIGCGGMGNANAGDFANRGADIVAVCDVDQGHVDAAVKRYSKNGKTPARFTDFRKLLESADVHAIINGTPDHWHTLINLAACRAGKDIYTEKPLTLTIDEGKRLVKTVRDTQRVVQVGSWQRSDRPFRVACELVLNGRIGKVQHVEVGLPTGPREGPFPKLPVPAGLNWDWYLGQAPLMDYNGHNCHGNFRWWYPFSGGQITDWGAHHFDIAQWGLGLDNSGPVEVQAKSFIEMIPGGYETASQYEINYRYANGVTMRAADEKRLPNGVKFIGSDGWIFVARGNKLEANKDELVQTPLPNDAKRLYNSRDHRSNLLECMRSRKDPICPVEVGHRSISVAHLGVISLRLGGVRLQWDPAQEVFTGPDATAANRWLSREQRAPYNYSFIG
jgi:predicted dehydrogenase